MQPKVSQV